MIKSKKTIEVTGRAKQLPAPLSEVFDAWLNPKVPGNPWNIADKLILNPEVDGFFLLDLPRDSPLRTIYGSQTIGSHSAYLDVAEYVRPGVASIGDV